MNRKKLLAFFAALTAAISAMSIPASAEDIFGDINMDGAIDSVDAACILQYAAYTGAGGTLDLKAFLNGESEQPTPEVPDTDDTLTIMAWTDVDFAVMKEIYEKKYPDAQVNISLVGWNGSGADEEFRTVIKAGDPVDLYLTEHNWIRSYIDNPDYALPLSSIGLTEADYVNAYPYAVEQGKNKDGVLYGAAYTISPGGFCYNADLAEQYLGVTSPEEMQARIGDWDSFTNTAADLLVASHGKVTMSASLGGMWNCFCAENTQPVYKNGAIQMEKFADFIALAQNHITNGYVDPTVQQWTVDWNKVGNNGETLGYFYASWNFQSGAQHEENGGKTGNWALVAGPQAYYWGGSEICVAPQCDSRSEAERFLRTFTVEADTMEEFSLATNLMVNNQIAVERIMASGEHGNPLLGGQDEYAILHETAKNIDFRAANASEYDWDLHYEFFPILEDNYAMSTENILDAFAGTVYEKYGIK